MANANPMAGPAWSAAAALRLAGERYARRDFLMVATEPRLFLIELPFWLILLYIAFTPGSISPWWDLNGLPVRSAEGVVIAMAILYAALAVGRREPWRAWRRAWMLLGATLLLFAWAAVSTLWSGLEDEHLAGMRLTLALAASAPLAAWGVIATHSMERERLYHFLWRLTAFLAAVSLIYAAESLLSLGLRSELGQNTFLDFGIERVKGPLFGSSTGYLILLPALAFALQHAIDVPARRSVSVAIVLALLTGMLGMGSRAALVLLGVFLAFAVLLINGARKRLIAITIVGVLTAAAAGIIFTRATTDRLQNFEDDSRRATHTMSLRLIEDIPFGELALGTGYGRIWNWYLIDARHGERLASGDNLVSTAYGPALYHSHSTLLVSGIELGVPGMVSLSLLIFAVIRMVRTSWRTRQWQALSGGVAASTLGLFFDLFLFKNTTVNLIWWFYLLGTVWLVATPRRPGTLGSEAS